MSASILVVDDEKDLVEFLATLLRREGYEVTAAFSAEEARRRMPDLCPDVVILDLRLGEADGAALMTELRPDYRSTEFIIITAFGSIRSAVECTREGAFAYLTKPFEPEELVIAVRNAVNRELLRGQVRRLRDVYGDAKPDDSPRIVSRSPAMREVSEYALKAARQNGIVLLLGESGVGKDYLAKWIHDRSRRSEGPYFVVNCAAISRELAESELFGHEPGAFTGSQGRKRGMVELASGGTLLLNEIGDLEQSLQAKLLSFLDDRSFLRVGGERLVRVDVRIIAATNRDLEWEVSVGSFRQDLYYRFAVLPIRIPPLRERQADIADLARKTLATLSQGAAARHVPRLTDEAIQVLEDYSWPGNIRELRNVLERALILAPGADLGSESLRLDLQAPLRARTNASGSARRKADVPALPDPEGWGLHENKRRVAREIVRQALERGGGKKEAARLLGISRHALAHQIQALGIEE